ncbi:cytochrome P450 [Sandaracinus amylolyticus]|uniref:cytochrome P450 n=1 Tax=Sandaracinus amylolyticus TaxID=927083 RepID=UPI001F15903C|nr:cytochrome P450 [Sandaracinus amylolyticus]UJR85131.1 Hypothetical protein I5071_72110 [Sandaracinus amylolyticus]
MGSIPRDRAIDGSLALLREGYLFLPRRFERLETEVFELRLMGMRFIAMQGRDAAALFYDPTRFVRRGAVPMLVQRTLLGERGVQTLDGDMHAKRKRMFMSLMSRDRIDVLMSEMWRQWYAALDRWQHRDQIVLLEEAQDVMCRAACAWAGVPLEEREVRLRAEDFGAMVHSFATIGPRHLAGRVARSRTEHWMGEIIERIRRGELRPSPTQASYIVASHVDANDRPLDEHDASVELMNVLRPIVAIGTYVTFIAHALHAHPDHRAALREPVDETTRAERVEAFVQEVRRFYPFTPFLGACVREGFEWRGHQFPKGRRVLLDVFGTDHDRRLFEDPDAFRPDRFRAWQGGPYDFIPQGGGRYETGHRCAGEWVTIEAMKVALAFLTRAIDFRFAPQDPHIDLSRIPTLPRSGMLLSDVRAVSSEAPRPPVTRPDGAAARV